MEVDLSPNLDTAIRHALPQLFIALLGAALLPAAFCSCGATSSEQRTRFEEAEVVLSDDTWPDPTPILPELATFSGLAAAREGSFVEADLIQAGDEMLGNPSPWNAAPAADGDGQFSPSALAGAPQSLGGGAWAIYRFVAPGYDRGPLLRLGWNGLAPDLAFAAVSNWNSGRWEWHSGSDSFDCGSLLPCFNTSGTLLLAVYVPAGGPFLLDSLRLGGTPPTAALQVSTSQLKPGGSVSFDASGTLAGEGSITEYRWDFNGDGSVDKTTLTPTTDHVYGSKGVNSATLTVVNSALEQASASRDILVLDFWSHSFGEVGADNIYDAVSDSGGRIYLCGQGTSSGKIVEFVACLNPLGEFQWARYYKTDSLCIGRRIRLAANGHLWVGGEVQMESNNHAVVQEWTVDGTLLSSRTVFPLALETNVPLVDMELTDTCACCCCTYKAAVPGQSSLLIWFPLDGSLPEGRYVDVANDCRLNDLELTYDALLQLSGYMAIGTNDLDSETAHPFIFACDAGTNLPNARVKKLELDSPASGDALLYRRSLLESKAGLFIAGTYEGLSSSVYLLSMPANLSGSSEFGGRCPIGLSSLSSLTGSAEEGFTASGVSTDGAYSTGYLLSFDGTSGFLDAYHHYVPDEYGAPLFGQQPYGDGLLTWGSIRTASSSTIDSQSPLSQGFSGTWGTETGVNVFSYSFQGSDLSDTNGDVSDALDSLTIDSGGGQNDMYISYREGI